MTEQLLQIGEVADRVGLSLRTVRYYEEMGLIVPADRTEGGFRLYTEDHVERLALIKQMKPLGFTVQEIRALLEARDVLAGDDVDDEARHAAIERLRAFSAATADRVDELREQLGRAEEFAKQLRRQTRRRPKAPAARS
jgi:DNA-binding transcriptional MerR regulator